MLSEPGNRLRLTLICALSGLTAMMGGTLLAEPTAEIEDKSLLPVVYFYSPTCLECQKARVAIDAAELKYAGRIRLERHSIATTDGLELMFAYEEKYGVKEGAPPKVFIGTHYLGDAATILAQLDAVIQNELASRQKQATTSIAKRTPASEPATAVAAPLPQYAEASESDQPVAAAQTPVLLVEKPPVSAPGEQLNRRFQSFQVGAIVLAGLVDGVNPCAFTTLVFLVCFLAYLGKTKRQIAVVGIAFTFAVFATYLLLGLGLMLAVKIFAVQKGISQAIVYAVAVLTFALAGWSLVDGIRIARSGKVPKGTLGLPMFLKRVIRQVITIGLKTPSLILGSLAVGFLVSLLESFCTGQVYLPTIMIMLRSSEHGLSAFIYLLIYNLMFILPLAIIMVLAYFGVRSERLGRFLKGHLAALKFALAGLFAGLGLILLLF